MTGPKRFAESERHLWMFLDRILVECDRCHACGVVAMVAGREPEGDLNSMIFQPRRFTCTACGRVKSWHGRSVTPWSGQQTDPYFGLRLWLTCGTRHGVLCAYNEDHLAYLERYIRAGLREREVRHSGGPQTLIEQLPAWIKSARNRRELLRAIDGMRQRLPAPSYAR